MNQALSHQRKMSMIGPGWLFIATGILLRIVPVPYVSELMLAAGVACITLGTTRWFSSAWAVITAAALHATVASYLLSRTLGELVRRVAEG